ncbi:DUF1839 family protein [Labrys wisconsinensis]|uniref:Serine--tRNA ligase n=1 Tax=Labrys wisconsinensis TaxID=425677 RepID=A0ABU0J135_9HYPH|nr:DUF1839 family protein [Labrys wisconsinensis]MDQ0467266.1 hypothetical protein [Labrys wisconsinensis]
MPVVFPGLEPQTYRRHALHDHARHWPETNCYVDLWIELLSASGHDPTAVMGFTLAQDFEGDQFTFFKMPAADLARLYGVEVLELSIFDRLESHVVEQVSRGRLPLVEVDAYFLPDTRGVTYRTEHSKTTIGVNRIDPAARVLGYFHNAGYFALEGEDYDAVLRPETSGGLPLFPYVEFVKFGAAAPSRDLLGDARALFEHHLARRPTGNPLKAWRAAFDAHAADLATRPPCYFHAYAFNTLRQVGANFELLASHLAWLAERGEAGLAGPRAAAAGIAETAKAMQFKLARAMARKSFDGLGPLIDTMARSHDELFGLIGERSAGERSAAA